MMKLFLSLFLWTIFLFSKELHTNALIGSESPYLLQHAHNPVNWVPFSDEAFKKAQKEKKLIFLSIGYSTCHWCHVMEEESFENERIAKILNDGYVSIKVDKEEMPQLDAHYQHIHSLLEKGRNGWPLTVILSPKGEVITIATYIPAEDAYGIEGMKKLLPRLSKSYHDNESRVIIALNKKKMVEKGRIEKIDTNESIASIYFKKMQKRYDKIYYGFDKRPRFPLAAHLNFLLELYLLENNKEAFEMVKNSLDAMARGGIYDQVEGGFYRYSTHPDWSVPHFEKMLYTQAELIPLYVKLYQLTGKNFYKSVVDETIKESLKIFSNKGLFYAATDADSEGREGGYFIYHYDEVEDALKKSGFSEKEIEENLDYFDIGEIGNFEDGFSNPQLNTGIEKVPEKMLETKAVLKYLRKSKQFPFIDKKMITSWNAMMIKALFIASKIENKYLVLATNALEALLEKMYHDRQLYHKYFSPHKPTQKAFLEDYAFLIDALLAGYEHTYAKSYLTLATDITEVAIEKFYDNKQWYLDEKHFALAQYNDKYYTSPLGRFYHDMITVANLNYDLKFLAKVKGFLKSEKERILFFVDKSPEAARALLRIEKENIVLKSSKENLMNSKADIDKISYPFLLTKVEDAKVFLLCNESTCFFYDKNITKVIKKIEEK